MNPNTQQNLDPKLKEAYDRVMGSQINPQQQTPAASQPQPPVQPQKLEQQPAPSQPSGPQPIININTSSSSAKPQKVEKVKGKGGIPSVVWIVLALLFFGGYTFIWLKVFKII